MPASPEVIQHWILHILVDASRRLSKVIPFVETISLNHRAVPGCEAEHYAAALLALHDAGKVEFHIFSRAYREENSKFKVADRELLETVLQRRLELPRESSLNTFILRAKHFSRVWEWIGPRDADLWMGLTPKGGAAWEAVARPDWNRHFSLLYGWQDEAGGEEAWRGEAWSPSMDVLMAHLGWSEEHQSLMIDRTSMTVTYEMDSQVTYWKTLPAYRAKFSCREAERSSSRWENCPAAKWFQEWKDSTYRWCTLPWELEGWPTDVHS